MHYTNKTKNSLTYSKGVFNYLEPSIVKLES